MGGTSWNSNNQEGSLSKVRGGGESWSKAAKVDGPYWGCVDDSSVGDRGSGSGNTGGDRYQSDG